MKNVLVATDFSDASEAALCYGKNFARMQSGALHVLHVVDDLASRGIAPIGPARDVGHLQMKMEEEARQRLDGLVSDEDRTMLRAHVAVVTSGSTAQAILSYARDAAIDLIIVGTHGRTGIEHFFMGSVAQQIVRTAPCPVLTVRHPEREFAHPDALQTIASR